MAQVRHLERAPILEAIFDFRVPANAAVTEKNFAALRDELKEEFPTVEERRSFQAKIEVKDKVIKADREDLGFHGLFLKSSDELTIAQFRRDGFTLNRLKPYTSWEQLRPLAIRLWEAFVECAVPPSVNRLALRYVNRLDLPLTRGTDFASYLAAPPTLPAGISQLVSAFTTKVTIHEPAENLAANVTQSLERAQVERIVVLLDIDVYTVEEVAVDRTAVGLKLEALRNLKNRIFFALLPDDVLKGLE